MLLHIKFESSKIVQLNNLVPPVLMSLKLVPYSPVSLIAIFCNEWNWFCAAYTAAKKYELNSLKFTPANGAIYLFTKKSKSTERVTGH